MIRGDPHDQMYSLLLFCAVVISICLSVSPTFLFHVVRSRHIVRGQVIEDSSCSLSSVFLSLRSDMGPTAVKTDDDMPTSHATELFYG